jgi:hypothetical protein
VLFWSEVDGKRVRTTTLLQHIQGKGGADKGGGAKSSGDDS